MANFAPRPYQLQAHQRVRDHWKAIAADAPEDRTGAMLVMATGTGKTLTALSFAIDTVIQYGARVVWLAGRQELLDQPARNMAAFWPEITTGIVQASRHSPHAQIVFASVATLAISPHRAEEIARDGMPALVVVDEAHHATSESWKKAIDAFPGALRLGLTATPHREDGADLSEDWEIVYSYGMAEAIRDGALVPPCAAVARIPDLHLEELSGRWDYDDGELGAELLRAGVVEHTVAAMMGHHGNTFHRLPKSEPTESRPVQFIKRPALVFTATVEQARLTAEALNGAGFRARHISGKTATADRRRMLRNFEAGRLDVLCNAAVLTEGTDLPRASLVVLARPTRSWALFVQMVGRGMRLYDPPDGPAKTECLILDLAGATEDHSLVSAPVLIGGSACPKAPNREHHYLPRDGGGAECEHCGGRLACFPNLGAHSWGQDFQCTACGVPKCPDSPTRDHAWIAQADHKRSCLYCGVEIRDPLASMTGSKKRRDDAVEGDWVRLPKVAPECAAVDVGEWGILFVTWEGVDPGAGFRPVWLPKKARNPRPLSDGPISREYVRAYADDLVTRAAKIAAVASDPRAGWKKAARPTDSAVRYGWRVGVDWKGENAGAFARRVFLVRARNRALKSGIVEEVL